MNSNRGQPPRQIELIDRLDRRWQPLQAEPSKLLDQRAESLARFCQTEGDAAAGTAGVEPGNESVLDERLERAVMRSVPAAGSCAAISP